MTGPVVLTPLDLLFSSALLIVFGAVSILWRLGLERMLAVAALRSTVQLSILGLLLAPVFALQRAWPVALWCVLMMAMAGREAMSRSRRRHPGMLSNAVAAMILGGGGSTLFATWVVIDVDPWWTPRYLIPLLGMILGNSLTGVSLGLDRVLAALDERRDVVEGLLAMGATPTEATRDLAREAIRTGLVPILNTMSAVGIVSIPGMMTGQILGGTDPLQAARYQILILFLIAGAVSVGTTFAVLVAVRASFDEAGRLRPPMLVARR